MKSDEPKPISSLPNETISENFESLESVNDEISNHPTTGRPLKQAVIKEIKTLVKSYVDYAKNVEL